MLRLLPAVFAVAVAAVSAVVVFHLFQSVAGALARATGAL